LGKVEINSPTETAGFLWYYGKPSSFFLTAGILNLAYKGLIRIEEIRSETARINGQIDNYRLIEVETLNKLNPSEKQTLKFFFKTVYDYFQENSGAIAAFLMAVVAVLAGAEAASVDRKPLDLKLLWGLVKLNCFHYYLSSLLPVRGTNF
jgi:hypothetical protein